MERTFQNLRAGVSSGRVHCVPSTQKSLPGEKLVLGQGQYGNPLKEEQLEEVSHTFQHWQQQIFTPEC